MYIINHTLKNLLLISALVALQYQPVKAQGKKWEDIEKTSFYKEETIVKGKYTLKFINKDSSFNQATQKRLIDLFFEVYPKEVEGFNPKAPKTVTFLIGDYKGIAATLGNIIKFDPAWFAQYPEDIDVATHELMHVIQAYKGIDSPGWLTEGIADYARYKYGINNNAAKWKLEYHVGQNYTNAYRPTARFLVWVEQHYKNFVPKINKVLAAGKYHDQTWIDLTGKSVDELWSLYSTDLVIS